MEKREKKNDSIFQHRLERHHDELRWLYMELYQNGDMFAELCSQMYEYYNCRSKKLKERDQMEWVRRANNARSRVDEIILNELVYV